MNQGTLFDCADDPAPHDPPRYPVEPWLVDELVRLGVARQTAEGYSLKQAHTVRARLARVPGRPFPPKGQPLADPDAPQVGRDGPDALPHEVSALERTVAAEVLAEVVADREAGSASADEVYRVIRGSLYVLTDGELVRVAKGLILVLRAEQ